jgi:hypothetical protein
VGLIHDAVELLEDPAALEVLAGLQKRGIPVRVSRESLGYLQREAPGFEVLEDPEWQRLAAQGQAVLL